MSQTATHSDLLACLVIARHRLLHRETLLAELRGWAGRRNGPFLATLRERGVLADRDLGEVESLVRGQLACHNGDVARCLSAFEIEDSFLRELEEVADRDLLDGLGLVGRLLDDDPGATRCDSFEAGDATVGSSDLGVELTLVGVESNGAGVERTQMAPPGGGPPEKQPDPSGTSPNAPEPPATWVDQAGLTAPGGPADSFLTQAPSVNPADSCMTLAPSQSPEEILGTTLEADPASSRGSRNSLASDDSRMRFRFVRAHARGGLGEVSVAHDLELRREVALKEIRLAHANHHESQVRFVQEAEITGFLEHPGVVPVYGLGRYADGRPYYAMRFIRGKSLKEVIEAYHAAGSPRCPMELRQLLGRFVDVCNTIGYAHSRRIIHRDIKPDNVMLGEFGETLVVDWGLAKQLDVPDIPGEKSDCEVFSGLQRNSSSTLPGALMGTPQYMSPEQASGDLDKLCPASDIYSLGSTLYCLLTGKSPYIEQYLAQTLDRVRLGEFPRPRTINPAIPPALEAVCLKAMMLRLEDRYESARALAEDVERWLADEPVVAMLEPWPERLARWARRHRAWVQAGAATLLVVSVVAVASALFINSAWARESAARRREDEQRKVVESLREERESRLLDVRRESYDLILKGQQALAAGQAPEARLLASRALAAIHSDPQLAELRANAVLLLERSDRQVAILKEEQAGRETLARFRTLHDEALFHGTLLTGLDQAASLDATRLAAGEALRLYGIDADAAGGSIRIGPHLGDLERREIETACYELLLVHADAVAQPRSSTVAGDPRTRYLQALRILDLAEKLDGPSRALLLRRSQYRDRLGDAVAARADREKVETTEASRPVDAFLMGDHWFRRGDLDQAIRSFETALRLQPDHFWAQYFLAACYLKLDRPALAKAGLTACLARRPEFLWVYLLRGYVHGELKEFDAAEADFKHILDSRPDELTTYGTYVNRGGTRVRGGRAKEAVEDLTRAIRLRPGQYQAHGNLGLAYQALDRPSEAREQFDRAIALAPTVASLHARRARFLRELGEFSAALAGYEEAARLEPAGSPMAAEDDKERGRILHILGRHEEAVNAYARAKAVLPGDRELQRLFAEALLAVDRGKEALEVFDQYLAASDRDAGAFRLRGFERAKLDDHAGALADYTSALAIEPNSPATRARRGWGFLNDSARLALHDFDEAIKLEPGDGDLYNGRGFARAQLGRHREAVEDAEKALRLGTPSPDPRARLGLLYNSACIYALAAGSSAHSPEIRDDPDLARRHADRAVGLAREALDRLPAESRAPFLRQMIEESAFLTIRDHPPLLKLLAELTPPRP